MNNVWKGFTAAALMVGLTAQPGEAQQKKFSLGIHGGYLNTGSLAEGPNNAQPVPDADLKMENGVSFGGGFEWWFGSGRAGLRLDSEFASNPFVIETGQDNGLFDTDNYADAPGLGDVTSQWADASLMLRLFPVRQDRSFAPFLSVGTGFMRWDHDAEDNQDFDFNDANALIYGDSQTEWALTFGAGTDIFFTPSVALRLEAKDYWNTDSPYLVLSDQDRDHEGGHNVVFRGGLQFFFGGGDVEEPGFVRPEPEPEPEPMPEPEPEPEMEDITMCVVTADGDVEYVEAVRMLDTREIYIDRRGNRVAFSTVYPATTPVYVRSARWYMADNPLVVDLATESPGDVDDELDDAIENRITAEDYEANRFEFVRFGSASRVPSRDLMYIGTIDGTPLWARTSEVGMLRTELENRLRVTSELDEILDDEDFAERFAGNIRTFYTAVEPSEDECVFQPLSTTHVVRRTRG